MKKKLLFYPLVILLATFLGWACAHAWTYTTPLGIHITAPDEVISQYEQYWGFPWSNINWGRVDETFLTLKQIHGVQDGDPQGLQITIGPLSSDDGANVPGFAAQEPEAPVFVIGTYPPGGETITMSFDKDVLELEGSDACCGSALSWEINRWFLQLQNDPAPNYGGQPAQKEESGNKYTEDNGVGLSTRPWTYTTPLGIHITASNAAISQYEQNWGSPWSDINWGKVDEIFLALQQFHGVQDAYPQRLHIRIVPSS